MQHSFKWKIQLDVTPEQLWQYVADTNSLNKAAGLSEWKLGYVTGPVRGSRQVGETRHMGWRLRWDEHAFEWVEGQEYSVLRVYHNGPVRRFHMSVVLHPSQGGTLLEETITIEPRWLLLFPAIYFQVQHLSRKSFERVSRRIERVLKDRPDMPAFHPGNPLEVSQGRINRKRRALAKAIGTDYLQQLIKAVSTLPDNELYRMRAFAFADRWGGDRTQVLKLFLGAAAEGMIDLWWDVICPSCRGAKVRESKLQDLREEAHCDACNITYTADFTDSVEVTFQPNPAIRQLDVTYYCSGGPMNAPHVVAQQVIGPHTSRTIALELNPWRYRLRSLKANGESVLVVRPGQDAQNLEVVVDTGEIQPSEMNSGTGVALTIRNESDTEHTMVVERDADRSQAATAAFVTTLSEFRNLFSSEVLAPDTEVRAGTVALMFTDLRGSTSMYESVGEAAAYRRVREHFELLRNIVAVHNGTFVKTIGDAVMAAFADPANAVAAAFAMHQRLREEPPEAGPPLALKIGVHAGPCFAVNMNGTLDYFGTTVNVAARIQKESRGGDIVVTDEVSNDAETRKLIDQRAASHEHHEIEIRGLSGTRRIHRLILV